MTTQKLNDEIKNIQYQVVASRRQAYDNLIWQTPIISLTAQAFLFQIALNKDSSDLAVIISSLLALIAAIASLQLMAKHRHHEIKDSRWLERFERKNPRRFSGITHARPPVSQSLLLRISSYKLWLGALMCFALAAILLLINGVAGNKHVQEHAASVDEKIALLQKQNDNLSNRLVALQEDFNKQLKLDCEKPTQRERSSNLMQRTVDDPTNQSSGPAKAGR